jgi:predicted ribonuclease YlaK
MRYKFYDTCSLLLKANHLWDEDTTIVISSITLEELERIKTAANKDPDVKFAARQVVNELDKHYGEYKVVLWHNELMDTITNNQLPMTDDSKIIACADYFASQLEDIDVISFVTNDLCCKHIARAFLKMPVESYEEETYDYNGYKEVYLDSDQMSDLYSNMDKNLFDLYINQYLIVYDINNPKEPVDRLCWTGSGYRHLSYNNFNSNYFGDVKPMKGDVYQSLAFDSLSNNKITMIKGPAGTGKTFISLGYLLHKLERNRIDKIIVFCNTVATKNSAKLGYYPGTRDEKLLDSQIGNLLISKFGGRIAVE